MTFSAQCLLPIIVTGVHGCAQAGLNKWPMSELVSGGVNTPSGHASFSHSGKLVLLLRKVQTVFLAA